MSSSLKKVFTTDLRVGMYVSKLDRDWLETPFILQGFHIESVDDINVVAEHCDYVWVDYKISKPETSGESIFATSRPPRRYENTVPVAQEHRRSSHFFNKARSITKSLLDEIQLEGTIDTVAAKATVNECVQSVLRHPDALMWMGRIRNESEYTAEHCLNVCVLAVAFGRHLGFSEEELQNLGLCGLLHDVGKMRVPPEILNKPDKLTSDEMKIMKAHTLYGRNLLLKAGNIYSGAVDVAYTHHERADGQGYPKRLEGSSIPTFAAIITIVDAYDAMTADRCYQVARTSTEALKVIYEERGKHFDEKLALKFLETVGLYPPGSVVELNSGEVGIVVETNHQYRQLPRVMIIVDENKNRLDDYETIDLSLVEKGELPKEKLVKQVWKDNSFGISLKECQEKGFIIR